MQCVTLPRITELNPHLICVLCGGYYVDATTIIECLHAFCKSCIVRYLETNKYCPICDVLVHKTEPLQSIRPDKTRQSIVYKLIPNLYKKEMRNRRNFYIRVQPHLRPRNAELTGDNSELANFFSFDDTINLSLEYLDSTMDRKYVLMARSSIRYYKCKAAVTIKNLRKLLAAKYALKMHHEIRFFHEGNQLPEHFKLLDIAYISSWNRIGYIRLFFEILIVQRSTVKEDKEENLAIVRPLYFGEVMKKENANELGASRIIENLDISKEPDVIDKSVAPIVNNVADDETKSSSKTEESNSNKNESINIIPFTSAIDLPTRTIGNLTCPSTIESVVKAISNDRSLLAEPFPSDRSFVSSPTVSYLSKSRNSAKRKGTNPCNVNEVADKRLRQVEDAAAVAANVSRTALPVALDPRERKLDDIVANFPRISKPSGMATVPSTNTVRSQITPICSPKTVASSISIHRRCDPAIPSAIPLLNENLDFQRTMRQNATHHDFDGTEIHPLGSIPHRTTLGKINSTPVIRTTTKTTKLSTKQWNNSSSTLCSPAVNVKPEAGPRAPSRSAKMFKSSFAPRSLSNAPAPFNPKPTFRNVATDSSVKIDLTKNLVVKTTSSVVKIDPKTLSPIVDVPTPNGNATISTQSVTKSSYSPVSTPSKPFPIRNSPHPYVTPSSTLSNKYPPPLPLPCQPYPPANLQPSSLYPMNQLMRRLFSNFHPDSGGKPRNASDLANLTSAAAIADIYNSRSFHCPPLPPASPMPAHAGFSPSLKPTKYQKNRTKPSALTSSTTTSVAQPCESKSSEKLRPQQSDLKSNSVKMSDEVNRDTLPAKANVNVEISNFFANNSTRLEGNVTKSHSCNADGVVEICDQVDANTNVEIRDRVDANTNASSICVTESRNASKDTENGEFRMNNR